MQDFFRLLRFCRPYSGRLAVAGVAMLGVSFFTLRIAALIRPLFDDVLAADARPGAWRFPLLVVAFYAGKGICSYAATYLMATVGQGVVRDLRMDLYRHVLDLPVGFYDATPGGEIVARLTGDVERVQAGLADKLTTVVRELLVMVALGAWLFWLDWQLAAVSLLVAPAAGVSLVRFSRRLRRSSRHYQEGLARLVTSVGDATRAHRIVKVFSGQRFELGRFGALAEQLRTASLRGARASALSSPLMELLGGVVAAVIFVYGQHQIQQGTMTVGEFTSFLASLFLMYTPLKKLNAANATLQQAAASATRVDGWRRLPGERRRDPEARGLVTVRHAIDYRGVSFGYRDGDVLHDVSFRARAGTVVALVGPSGAGKSTLVGLLPRFYDPTAGSILIDGVDIRSIELDALRSRIGMVTQDTVLFHDTVFGNIAYAADGPGRAQVEAAARAAHADAFIEALPQGYDTVVGEGGVQLSGGERQRIAIARALLKNPPILILDEATSALDVESERLVQAALERLVEGRTVLVIAHRMSTVRRADHIVVLDGGRVVETGSPSRLMGDGGAFARMLRLDRADEE